MTLAQNDLPEALRFTSSWSIGEDAYRAIVTDMRERNAQCVVEFGSGTSTVRFSRDLQAAIVSIESDAKYVQQTSDEVNAHGESQKVQLHHRPIAWQRHALSFFRSFEPGVFPSGIDAVLIDGPPITTRRGREACLYQVFANANVGCRIYLDDYCRKSEQRIVKNWLRAYSGALKLVQTFDVDHTIAVLEKTSDLRTSPLPRFKTPSTPCSKTRNILRRRSRRGSRRRSSIPSKTRLHKDIAFVALALWVCAAPLCFAGALPWSSVAIACMGLFCLLVVVLSTESIAPLDKLGIAMVGAWLWTCVQAIPLPHFVASAFGLGSLDHLDRLNEMLPSALSASISFDPAATRAQIVVGVAVLCAYLATRFLGERYSRKIAAAAALSAAIVAVVTVFHEAANATSVYGFHTPRFARPRLLSPLMNNNHLGGFMSLGSLLAVGLASDASNAQKRVGWILITVGCAAIVPLTLSRGALAAWLLGALSWAIVLYSRRRQRSVSLWATLAIASSVAAIAFMELQPVLSRFHRGNTSKIETALEGFNLLQSSEFLLGVGRGAFSPAFATLNGSFERYVYPENLVVQWMTEWGAPISLWLMATASFVWFRKSRAPRTMTEAGVCIALFALVAQNMVDFSLEMPGIVVVASALLGTLSLPDTIVSADENTLRRRFVFPVVFLVALLLFAPGVIHNDVQRQTDRLSALLASTDKNAFDASLMEALSSHPLEPAFSVLAGTFYGRNKHASAPLWLSFAMERAPGWASPHAVTAELLMANGHLDQALVEIREAESRQAASAKDLVCAMLKANPRMNSLTRSAPPPPGKASFYDRATSCPGLTSAFLEEIDAALIAIEPAHANATLRQVRRAVSRKDFDNAGKWASRALEAHPSNASLYRELAEVHLAAGQPKLASDAIHNAESLGLTSRTLLETKAEVLVALKQTDKMRATLMRLRGRSSGDRVALARARTLEGKLEAQLGHVERAITAHEASASIYPSGPGLRDLAKLAEDTGRTFRAYHAHKMRCKQSPKSDSCAHKTRLESKLGRPSSELPTP